MNRSFAGGRTAPQFNGYVSALNAFKRAVTTALFEERLYRKLYCGCSGFRWKVGNFSPTVIFVGGGYKYLPNCSRWWLHSSFIIYRPLWALSIHSTPQFTLAFIEREFKCIHSSWSILHLSNVKRRLVIYYSWSVAALLDGLAIKHGDLFKKIVKRPGASLWVVRCSPSPERRKNNHSDWGKA